MKKLTGLALIIFSTSLLAVNVSAGNNMGQEPSPRVQETNASMTDTNVRRNDSPAPNYGSERVDSISTGQSATRRNNSSVTTPTAPRPSERCIDRSGYSYNKNDSGFAACINQSTSTLK